MWIVVEGKDTGLVSIWKFEGDENTDADARQYIIDMFKPLGDLDYECAFKGKEKFKNESDDDKEIGDVASEEADWFCGSYDDDYYWYKLLYIGEPQGAIKIEGWIGCGMDMNVTENAEEIENAINLARRDREACDSNWHFCNDSTFGETYTMEDFTDDNDYLCEIYDNGANDQWCQVMFIIYDVMNDKRKWYGEPKC